MCVPSSHIFPVPIAISTVQYDSEGFRTFLALPKTSYILLAQKVLIALCHGFVAKGFSAKLTLNMFGVMHVHFDLHRWTGEMREASDRKSCGVSPVTGANFAWFNHGILRC